MPVEAIGAAVDLRGAHLNELNQTLFQTTLLDISLDLRTECIAAGAALYAFSRSTPMEDLWSFVR